jgi:hypothetical protein
VDPFCGRDGQSFGLFPNQTFQLIDKFRNENIASAIFQRVKESPQTVQK